MDVEEEAGEQEKKDDGDEWQGSHGDGSDSDELNNSGGEDDEEMLPLPMAGPQQIRRTHSDSHLINNDALATLPSASNSSSLAALASLAAAKSSTAAWDAWHSSAEQGSASASASGASSASSFPSAAEPASASASASSSAACAAAAPSHSQSPSPSVAASYGLLRVDSHQRKSAIKVARAAKLELAAALQPQQRSSAQRAGAYTYRGSLLGQQRHGVGQSTCDSGAVFVGEYRDDKCNGHAGGGSRTPENAVSE